ncbi:hypothetical protein VNO77_34399 [Canavalia gladiata]|uniref:Uncharacterized protein n=1 Tax=Canavalia gladiata TaxID=3824 RepID=A0AAN9KG38_CANGL
MRNNLGKEKVPYRIRRRAIADKRRLAYHPADFLFNQMTPHFKTKLMVLCLFLHAFSIPWVISAHSFYLLFACKLSRGYKSLSFGKALPVHRVYPSFQMALSVGPPFSSDQFPCMARS